MKKFNNRNFNKSENRFAESKFNNDNKDENADPNKEKLNQLNKNDQIDQVYGFELYKEMKTRTGWLINMKPTDAFDDDKRLVSAMVYYFMEEDGSRFKSVLMFQPYFCIATKANCENEVETYLKRKYGNSISAIETVVKEDLDLANHLSGLKRTFLKVSFYTSDDLTKVRKELLPKITRNKKKLESTSDYSKMLAEHFEISLANSGGGPRNGMSDPAENIVDMREYDVPYHVRVSIDMRIFVGKWYDVAGSGRFVRITPNKQLEAQPDPVVLAYDIETTKLPLKFPDASFDQVMMISYMVDGQGYLICNREIIAEDIDDFEFTPRPEFPGPFLVFNEPDEKRTLERFFEHVRELRPHIFVTYNGDFFDWPFVEKRAASHGLDMTESIGFARDSQDEYKSRAAIHMDCFRWVQRDSYLPIGAQGLKAVCKAKLRYDPVEVDPEDMCRLAREDPRTLANYSVSDAVATYYLYMKYVHPFIFALCTIIPMDADEVLRKGSGTLCECLLMVEAYNGNIVFPNKQQTKLNELTADGHLLESETYVGGHVEAIESGVFRADIPTKFRIVPEMSQLLRDNLAATMKHAIEVEEKLDLNEVTNLDAVLAELDGQLAELQNTPNRFECPVIYHLDVAAMYPNIILSNRLQPSALVTDKECGQCDHNVPGARCKRPMAWKWRAEVMPASKSEFFLVQSQLETEKFPSTRPGGEMRSFHELSKVEQAAAEKERMVQYCKTAYRRRHETRLEERISTVCQKENSFYVDTVRAFRDRRYEFKDLTKVWKKRVDELMASTERDASEVKRANGMLVLNDSLQLAHKCILNSFYGYVMRRGARWYSMEMAGIVCLTGAAIIKQAREVIEQIGRPLELDTDGIWCMLPASFPQNVTFRTRSGGKRTVSYPGAMLNIMVQQTFTNDQYHVLADPVTHRYEIRSENSIFFEVDGPYRAMILPASKEQGKKLKKRYAVFNFDGSLAELKGFEVKRNGELNLIKIFQSAVFEAFLRGTTLEEIYASVAGVANNWLDLLYDRASTMADDELFELISEKRCMSKKLAEYGKQKSTSISTARRLAEFLGDEMVKDAGLSFKFIISRKPEGQQVTERAVPLAIFQADEKVKRHYLSKWTRCNELESYDIKSILDWDYYIGRFSSNIQKIITIPAALQNVANPVPRVAHPDWLHKKLMDMDDTFKQKRIDDMFQPISREEAGERRTKQFADIENCGGMTGGRVAVPMKSVAKRKRALGKVTDEPLDMASIGPVVSKGDRTKRELLAWLAYHKKKWAVQKAIRTANERSVGVKRARTVLQTGISTFLTRTNHSIMRDTWQIVQIAETGTPGQFRLWAMVGHELHCISLSVMRTFYVNTRVVKETAAGAATSVCYKRVRKQLPRSHIVHNLYEYSIEEATFLQYESDITAEFVKNEVEGVYELKVPLMFRALALLGCLCSLKQPTRDQQMQKTASSVFQLDELKFKSVSQTPYLPVGECPLRFVLVFQHKSGPRNQVLAVLVPSQNRAHLVLVEQAKSSNTNKLVTTAQSIYGHEWDTHRDSCRLARDITFEVTSETSDTAAYRVVNKLLVSYRNESKSPTAVVTRTRMPVTDLISNMPVLAEFPLVPLPQSESDNSLSVLDWQRVAIKSAIRSMVIYESLLEHQLERARYLHVPVGNLTGGFTADESGGGISLSCDLFYARYLLKADHVLWCSPLADPDLGGKETVDRRLLLVDSDSCSGLIERNCPGSYHTVCVSLDMTYLPINTILAMHKISEIDGTNGRLLDSANATAQTIDRAMGIQDPTKRNLNLNSSISSYDDTTAVGPAFRLLRTMISDWIGDVRNYGNTIADEHIVGFYKWMRSPSALLYDPALYKTLQKLMRKLFFKLVEQLNNLGLEVVYGSLSRLVVCTKRTDLTDALTHVEYATKTVRQHEIFSSLDFQLVKTWDLLVWQDRHNFSGIKSDFNSMVAHPSSGTADSTTGITDDLSMFIVNLSHSQVFSKEIADTDRVEIDWHLSRYLSPASGIQLRFIEVLQFYMIGIWKIVTDEYKLSRFEATTATHGDDDDDNHHQPRLAAKGPDASSYASTARKIDTFLTEDLVHKLYTMMSQLSEIPKMYNNVTTLNSNEGAPPLLPLKNKQAKLPLVDFTKTICHILSFDPIISKHIFDWRRNMLKLINVNEYSKEAIWRSPYSIDSSSSKSAICKGELLITVPELICDYCNMSRDLDLCRDSYRVFTKNSWWFACPSCEKLYNKNAIESTLSDQLNGLVEAAIMQDLRCSKCYKGILETSLAGTKNCTSCGNSIMVTRSAELLRQQLLVYSDIGSLYDMLNLKCVAQWMIACVPAQL